MDTLEFVYFLLRFWIIVRLFCGVAEKSLFFLCCGALGETRSGGDTSGIVVKGHQLPSLSHAKFQERTNQLHLLGRWLFRKYPPISSYSVLCSGRRNNLQTLGICLCEHHCTSKHFHIFAKKNDTLNQHS